MGRVNTVASAAGRGRRAFLTRGLKGAAGVWVLSLEPFMARQIRGAGVTSPYGPVRPTIDETTGLPLLRLPEGFRYASFSWTGDPMADGIRCPSLHDGMGVIDAGTSGRIVLVRNHEGLVGRSFAGRRPLITYADGVAGGTTNLTFDTREGRWLEARASLAGTMRNCAGGVTPWGTWISGEETTAHGHGWCFEVGVLGGDPTPLAGMGRFSHEAVMVDPATGWVYETEDDDAAGFYRFVPHVRRTLKEGGTLSMLRVKGKPNLDLGRPIPVGTVLDVEWVRIDDPAAARTSTFAQGAAAGGARFSRLEGCWWGRRTGYFLSTDGGSAGKGQVFEYDPEGETLTVVYDSPAAGQVDNPDNMTVTPRGGLLLCEDFAGDEVRQGGTRLVGLTTDGGTFTFAANDLVLGRALNDRVPAGDYRQREWAGVCYSPDGRWLFVNIQTPGVTFAITGPWGRGPL
jgi:uncharacterized repeat protein (TIGR03803 family)